MAEKRIYAGGEFLVTNTNPDDVFTPEDFTEEHKMIRDTAKEFIDKEVLPVMDQLEEKDHKLILELHAKAGELGLLGTDIPEEYDGLELDKISTTIVTEAMGKGGSYCVIHGAHTGIGCYPIVYFGNHEQKAKYLPKLATGEWVGAYCLTESGSGSDALNAKTKAVLSEDGKHYILNGEKVFITNAGYSKTFVVYAKVDGTDFTGFIVEDSFEGVSTGKEEHKMGAHGSSTRPVILQDAKVPVENVLYEVGKGAKVAFNVLNLGRWKLGAGTTGGAKASLEGTAEYVNQRYQFGKPISSFGMIREKLANVAIRAYMSESVIYRIAGMFDDKLATLDAEAKKSGAETAKAIEEYATECSISKVFGSECLDYAVDEYVQSLGGYGYCAEFPAERAYRDARINRIWEGTNEINRMLIPGTLLKRALQGKVDLFTPAMSIGKEMLAYSPADVKLSDAPLAAQNHMISMAKKIALLLTGVAAQKFQDKMAEEQEVLHYIADIVTETYAMESGLLRAQKLIAKDGAEAAKLYINAVECYVDETMPKIEKWAKQALAYVESGDMLATQIAGVKKFARCEQIDTISRKKVIADRIVEFEKYPF